MKILEICPFSSGIDGVFSRVLQETALLSKKGHDVVIFSSNLSKGDNSLAKPSEIKDGVLIKRFNHNRKFFDRYLSENMTYFNFRKEFELFKPDIVITHLLHPHSFKALKLCKKNKIPCYLVTHAPFAIKRNFLLSIATKLYYSLKIKRKINMFDKIISITNWERPYLFELGVKKEKIIYIPNGVSNEFFKVKPKKEENKILFLGRISPVKNIETLIRAIPLLEDNKVYVEIVGSAEKKYLYKLKKLILEIGVEKRVIFSEPVFDLNKKINKIDSCKIFVLPSIREGMPQSLIEAMARKKIVIASNNLGNKDLVNDSKNGYIFETGNYKELAHKINISLKKENRKIKENAYNSVKIFNWNKNIEKMEKEIL